MVCRIELYLLPVMQGFYRHLAVMVLYIIYSIALVPSLQCYPAVWFSDAAYITYMYICIYVYIYIYIDR